MKKRKLTEETRSMPCCQFAAGCDFMLRLLSIVTVFVTVASAYGIQQPEEPPLAPERPKLINNAASAVGERAAEVQLKRLTSEEPQLVLDTGAFLGEIVELAFSSNVWCIDKSKLFTLIIIHRKINEKNTYESFY